MYGVVLRSPRAIFFSRRPTTAFFLPRPASTVTTFSSLAAPAPAAEEAPLVKGVVGSSGLSPLGPGVRAEPSGFSMSSGSAGLNSGSESSRVGSAGS